MTMTATETETKPIPGRRKRRFWLKFGIPVIIILILGVALWVWISLGFVYSSAQRTGYVKSLSQRGWLCKTWEGELAVSPAPGLADTNVSATFAFSIRNDSVARALQLAAGQKVTVSYDEHRGIPSTCFGETENFVQGFRVGQ
jgi:hypothetical protein